jgi:hypothetical protein
LYARPRDRYIRGLFFQLGNLDLALKRSLARNKAFLQKARQLFVHVAAHLELFVHSGGLFLERIEFIAGKVGASFKRRLSPFEPGSAIVQVGLLSFN